MGLLKAFSARGDSVGLLNSISFFHLPNVQLEIFVLFERIEKNERVREKGINEAKPLLVLLLLVPILNFICNCIDLVSMYNMRVSCRCMKGALYFGQMISVIRTYSNAIQPRIINAIC